MYCPVENSVSEERGCQTRCCRLYDAALSFLGAVLFFLLGVILTLYFPDFFAGTLSLFVASFVIMLVVFIVTMLTRGCCNNRDR